MYLIGNLTNQPLQTMTLILPNGNPMNMSLYFVPQQFGWFIPSLTYQTFTLNGLRVCNNPNMLYQWRNILPFGLACFSTQSREPSQQNDFISGASNLYLLDSSEVEELTTLYQSGTA